MFRIYCAFAVCSEVFPQICECLCILSLSFTDACLYIWHGTWSGLYLAICFDNVRAFVCLLLAYVFTCSMAHSQVFTRLCVLLMPRAWFASVVRHWRNAYVFAFYKRMSLHVAWHIVRSLLGDVFCGGSEHALAFCTHMSLHVAWHRVRSLLGDVFLLMPEHS